jgi:hypothetical protein
MIVGSTWFHCATTHKKKLSCNSKQVFEDNYEPPLVLFDIHASRGNQCSNERKIFQENLLEVYCEMLLSQQVAQITITI